MLQAERGEMSVAENVLKMCVGIGVERSVFDDIRHQKISATSALLKFLLHKTSKNKKKDR